MSSSSSSHLSFHQSLALTALGASILTSSIILSYQALKREHRTERLKREVGQDVEEWEKRRAGSGAATPDDNVASPGQWEERQREWGRGEFDESLIREQVGYVARCLAGYAGGGPAADGKRVLDGGGRYARGWGGRYLRMLSAWQALTFS